MKNFEQLCPTKELMRGYVHAVFDTHQLEVIGMVTEHEDPLPFLIGKVMRALKGRANPTMIKELLEELLDR